MPSKVRDMHHNLSFYALSGTELPPQDAMSRSGDRLHKDRQAGLLSYDAYRMKASSTLPHNWTVMWLENRLDCRIWSYYCDLRRAMAHMHRIVGWGTALPPDKVDLIVVGPRMSMNLWRLSDPLGVSRRKWAHVPLAIIQNKMYTCTQGEFCGDPEVKLQWASQAGTAAAFTWLTRHHEFTRRAGVKHHWLPFGVDVELYGRYAGNYTDQPVDVAFTGTSDRHKYPLRHAILNALDTFGRKNAWNVFIGSWTKAAAGPTNGSDWQRDRRIDYVQRIARSKMWISTTGPDWIVGTRYFEVLASGTTLLLCNRPPPGMWVADGLFEDGVHVQMFDSPDDMRQKINYFLSHESERRRIVEAARELSLRLHSWRSRAEFITQVVHQAVLAHPPRTPWYTPPSIAPKRGNGMAEYVGCFAEPIKATGASSATSRVASAWQEQTAKVEIGYFKRPYSGGFNVSACEQRCIAWPHFALICGGFCKGGDVHSRGRCQCGSHDALRRVAARSLIRKKCEATCSLHDDRPCGSAAAMAVYNQSRGYGMGA